MVVMVASLAFTEADIKLAAGGSSVAAAGRRLDHQPPG
jgi:hypothetical protein